MADNEAARGEVNRQSALSERGGGMFDANMPPFNCRMRRRLCRTTGVFVRMAVI
jgi:hypothetical protein